MTQERMDRIVQLAVVALCDDALVDEQVADAHFDRKSAAELARLVLEEMKDKGGWAFEPPPLPAGYVPKKWDELRKAVNEGRPSGYSFDELIAQLLHAECFRKCSQCGAGDCTHDAARSVIGLVGIMEAAAKYEQRSASADEAPELPSKCERSGCERCGKSLAWNEKFVLDARIGEKSYRQWPVCGECYDAVRERWGQGAKHVADQSMHPVGRCQCAGEGQCAWCRDTERREIGGKAADKDGVRLKW